MVPEGWSEKKLADLCAKPISYGIVQTGEKNVGSIPCVRVVDLTKQKIIRSEMITTTDEISRSYKKTVLERDEIMLALRGEIGLVRMVPDDLVGCNLTRGIARIAPKENKVAPEYLLRQIQSAGFRRDLMRRVNGSALQEIPLGELRNVRVAVAPLPEQRKIADILSTWDRAIDTSEALLATARTQKRALMQTLLTGKRRFPEFEGQEWREVRLGDVGAVSSAGVDKKTDPNQPEVRLLNFLDVFRREFIFDAELDHVVSAPPAKVEQCNVKRGDVFFTPSSETRDEIAIPAVAAEDMPGVCYSYHVVRYRLKEDWDLNFRAYVFQTDGFRRQAFRLGDGSGQRYVISQNNFRQMVVRVPGLAEQKKIGAVLKAASEEVGRLEKDIEKLRTEKKALMQQLLTGKRRVQV